MQNTAAVNQNFTLIIVTPVMLSLALKNLE